MLLNELYLLYLYWHLFTFESEIYINNKYYLTTITHTHTIAYKHFNFTFCTSYCVYVKSLQVGKPAIVKNP